MRSEVPNVAKICQDHPCSQGTSGDGTNMITPDAMSLGLSLSSDDDEGGSTDDKENKKHPTKVLLLNNGL